MRTECETICRAREHLLSAYEDIREARARCAASHAMSAACRALDHLHAGTVALEQARRPSPSDERERRLETAYAAAWLAWRRTHDVIFDWSRCSRDALVEVEEDTRLALDALERPRSGRKRE